MYQEIIDIYSAQVEKLIAPAQQFAMLSISNGEKLYAMQLEIAQSYVNLGIEQVKALVEVKDPESLQAFIAKQVDVARNVSEKLIADGQAVAELGNQFNSETQKLARESMSAVVSQAA
jgi:phasin family protein